MERVSLKDLLRPEPYYPVYNNLLEVLDPASIICLSRTCKQLSSLYEEEGKRSWDPTRILRKFVDDVSTFRKVMYDQGALVSGSQVLQFFDRQDWPGTDMDVFVSSHRDAVQVATYLKAREGYAPDERDSISSYLRVGFRGESLMKGDSTRIQVLFPKWDALPGEAGSLESTLGGVLETFYGTHLMNVLTWSHAYSLFPRTTFVERGLKVVKSMRVEEFDHLAKSQERGWNLLTRFQPQSENPMELVDDRVVGDQWTWSFSFPDLREALGQNRVYCESVDFNVKRGRLLVPGR